MSRKERQKEELRRKIAAKRFARLSTAAMDHAPKLKAKKQRTFFT
jgi:hypothetical protein